jgi:taurine--2-oxoglutarate transaminase
MESDIRNTVELARRHVIHSWSTQAEVDPLEIAGGAGSYFWDAGGRRYLDFASQLMNLNLGHQHPRLVAAIQRQASELVYAGPPFATRPRSELARLLAEITPGSLSRSFFTNGGAEANENALKLARWVTGRDKVIARYRSYHGATAGSISMTGDPRRWYAEPGVPGVVRAFDPYCYRCPAGRTDGGPCPVCLGAPHLEEIIQYEGADRIAAIVLETVPGTNGVIVPRDGYLQSVRELCDRHGILLILDEVMCGFGRTGRWFACEHWDVEPDMLVVAKGINSGYVPLGALIVGGRVAEWVESNYFAGGLTYSGHPLACAVAVESIHTMREESVVENAAAMGELVAEHLRRLQARHPVVGEVRGLGLFWMVEMVRSRASREMLVPFNASGADAGPVARLTQAARDRGLYVFIHWNNIMIAPPLTSTAAEIDEGMGVIDEILTLADELVTAS